VKLLSIRLSNFRQFYGKTPEINLAANRKNVTVIHGNNGAGKTTILNAFTWVLYEKFTAAFSSPDLLINKRAIAEAKVDVSVECWAEVLFEHDEKRYQVKRQFFAWRDTSNRVQYGKARCSMLISGDDGKWYHPTEPPEEIIGQTLPESLHHYFFFDGERIDHIFRATDKSRIAEDTKELLGLKTLDWSIEHIKKAKKTLQEELRDLGEGDIKKLLKEQEKCEKELGILQDKAEKTTEQLREQEEIKSIVSAQLLELSGAQNLKNLKEQLENQEKKLRQTLLQTREHLKKTVSTQGYLAFTQGMFSKLHTLMASFREQGELPSGVKQEFIEQLLEKRRCLCGSDLIPGEGLYQQVESWLNRAGKTEIEEGVIRLESQVKEMGKQTAVFWQSLDRDQLTISQTRQELSEVETKLADLRQKFRDYPDEDIQNLQAELDRIEVSLRELIREQGSNQHQQEILKKELDSLDKQITRQKIREEKQALAHRRIVAAQDAGDRLIEMRQRLENQFRLSLEQRIQEIFALISFTPYLPRLNQDYELRLVENTSGIAVPVAASTGENQILSLSFIGGIIDRVREWSKKKTLITLDSSTFPIVMDSPFGSLDQTYRRQVAKYMPQIANQLIVLVTQTQWRSEVEEEMQPYLGKEYILVYHSPKEDCQEESFTREGVSYPLVIPSRDGYEYTEILEIN
jgi:DNA sulfur modification protein DndD